MLDLEKVIKGLEETEIMLTQAVDRGGEMAVMGAFKCLNRVTDAIDLLKEQEAKTGHWIFESRYCDAWSNICSECGRLMTTGEGVYANYCSNCGAKMTGGEEK